ncbi:uncharacterized protein LOC116182210 [Photinus pyralis]|nr:uncharacterized protein LOC116182210 [Photinus pyralis]
MLKFCTPQGKRRDYMVNPGSKAAIKGIREGDIITSINNQPTKDFTNSDAHLLLKSSGEKIKLGLNEDCKGSPKRRQYKTVQQENHSESIEQSNTQTSSTKTVTVTIKRSQIEPVEYESEIFSGTVKVNGQEHSGKRFFYYTPCPR